MFVGVLEIILLISFAYIPISAIKLDYFPKNGNKANFLWINSTNDHDIETLAAEVDRTIDEFDNVLLYPHNIVNCQYDMPPPRGTFCVIDSIRKWYPCTKENLFGYRHGTPCIFITIEKKLGWVPDTYNAVSDLPDDMPQDIRNEIVKRSRERPETLNNVWVSCDGETPEDRKKMGSIRYVPMGGFPGYYFPATDVEGYVSPLFAIVLNGTHRGVKINIKCKAWAKNVRQDGDEQDGTLQFDLMVDLW